MRKKNVYSTLYLEEEFRKIKISQTKVILKISNEKTKLIDIKDSPHYIFVKNYLLKTKFDSTKIFPYETYYKNNWTELSPEDFIELIESCLTYYNYKKDPIKVFKGIRPLESIGNWVVIDGFHRIAILSALNRKSFLAKAYRRINPNFIKRLFEKFAYN